MDLHRGRLIDHIHLRARDLAATQAFYAALLGALNIPVVSDATHLQADELWIDAADGKTPAPTHVHLAFQAADREQVDAAWQTALAAGGKDNGQPGERPYHPGYYAGFLWDPDGNNIEVVFHGEAKRSAASVVVTFTPPRPEIASAPLAEQRSPRYPRPSTEVRPMSPLAVEAWA